uniref:Uncharacterized protein n=1 Tax=Romanomermis culicivorax TaxID=13658 RepID=A0A915IA03_ROMCU
MKFHVVGGGAIASTYYILGPENSNLPSRAKTVEESLTMANSTGMVTLHSVYNKEGFPKTDVESFSSTHGKSTHYSNQNIARCFPTKIKHDHRLEKSPLAIDRLLAILSAIVIDRRRYIGRSLVAHTGFTANPFCKNVL